MVELLFFFFIIGDVGYFKDHCSDPWYSTLQ